MRLRDWLWFLRVRGNRSHSRRRVLRPVPRTEQLEQRTLLAAPHPVDLGTLNGTTGFRLDGIDPDDRAGFSVSDAGDINGDGFGDLIIGAPTANSAAGEAYIVFGKSGGFASAIDLGSLDGSNGFRLDAGSGQRLGASVSSAGDVNGDGFDDLIVGVYLTTVGGNPYAGTTYVLFGKSGSFTSAVNLGTLDGTDGFRLDGIDAFDQSGAAVSAAGDVNGDGFDDLIIGAPDGDPNTNTSAGETYVVFGKSGGFGSAIDLGALDGTNGLRLDGVPPTIRPVGRCPPPA
ncbi:MAG: hypothetical protein D6725_12575, partial [Planctomycetota bacterium]